MARPGLTRHRKFARLERLLGNRAIARGSLELLWEVGYEAGDARIGSSADVEHIADWQGNAGYLTTALVEAGFLDDSDGSYSIHDLYGNAPEYVKKRMDREAARRAAGVTISELRAEAARAALAAKLGKTESANGSKRHSLADKRQQTANIVQQTALPPLPLPKTNERSSETEILTRQNWEDGKAEICKLANSCGSRLWPAGGDKRPKPADRHLVLKAAALAVAAPCRPYSVQWLETAIEAGLTTKRTNGLRNPGAYLHKVLARAAEAAGRNFNADLAAATAAIPEKAFQCGEQK